MVDSVAPSLLSAAPKKSSQSIPTNANLVLTFSEAVEAGSGYISLIGGSGGYGSNSKYIDINDTSQITFDGSVVTINPRTDLATDQIYTVRFSSGVIKDVSGNSFSGISDVDPLYFYTGSKIDNNRPSLLNKTPSNDIFSTPLNANLVLSFNEAVTAGSGFIFIDGGDGIYGSSSKFIDVTDSSQVSFSGNSITINPRTDFEAYRFHSVTFSEGTIVDLSGNSFEGISDQYAFNFYTGPSADTTAPTLLGHSPIDNAWAVPLNVNLVLTFSEDIAPGSGAFLIDAGGSGSNSKLIDVNDSAQVTFSGKTVTINPNSDFAKNAAFIVTFPDGVVKDIAGNSFSGVSNTKQFNFWTGANVDDIPPNFVGAAPGNNSKSVPLNANLVLTFNEAVAPGSGFISIIGGYGGYGSNSKYIDVTDATQVSFLGKTVIINPSSDFSADQSYSVQISDGVINDLSGNPFSGLQGITPLYFYTGSSIDNQSPSFVSGTPADDAQSVPINANIVLTFNEAVAAGSGYIFILTGGGSSGTNSKYIDVTDSSQVSFLGNTVTINPYSNLSSNSPYNVTFSSGVFNDLSGNSSPGISETTRLNFITSSVADVGSPKLISSFPYDDSTSVPLNANITLNFDEDISAGSGYIIIHDGGSGSTSKSIDVTDSSQISFSGKTVTINPTSDLAKNKAYHVLITESAIKDVAGNNYPGISDTKTLNFVTASSADNLAPTIISSSPLGGATDVAVGDNITMTFSESIQRGTGLIQLRTGSINGEVTESFNIGSSPHLSLSGNMLTIDPMNDLVNGTQYFLTIPAGSLLDLAGNPYLGSTLTFAAVPLISKPIYGTLGADALLGTKSKDLIFGLGGADTITGAGGDDEINGGDGTDTASYLASAKSFDVRYSLGLFFTKDRTEAEGNDILSNVEYISFADQTVDLSIFSKTATLTKDQISNLVELYIASFNRAPDALGLNYWGSQLASGSMDLNQIAKSFFVQPETIAAYASSPSTAFFVTKVYNNVLSRGPDEGGLTYWIDAIDGNRISKDMFLLAIINGAKADSGSVSDKMTLRNKVDVGMDYAFTEGLSNTRWASDVMSSVNSTSASVTEAKLKTDAYAISALKPDQFELTVRLVGIWDVAN